MTAVKALDCSESTQSVVRGAQDAHRAELESCTATHQAMKADDKEKALADVLPMQ